MTAGGWALVLALAGWSCGGSDDAKPGPTTRNTRFPPPPPVENEDIAEGTGACGLLNRAEVEAAVAAPVNPGTGVRARTNESCQWPFRSGASQFVGVLVSTTGRDIYESTHSKLAGTAQELPGVADRAFVANDTAYALKGDRLVIVSIASTQPAEAKRQAATKLLQSAVTRG